MATATATIFYALTIIVAGSMSVALWWYATATTILSTPSWMPECGSSNFYRR